MEAASNCERVASGGEDCFQNKNWTETLSRQVHVSRYRINANVIYDRKDGNIIESRTVSVPNPRPIDREGLLNIYDAIFGTANLLIAENITEMVEKVRYQVLLFASDSIKEVNDVQAGEPDYSTQ